MPFLRGLISVFVPAFLVVTLWADGAAALDSARPVTIQLKWLHQFQFAGYYAAIQQGYFTEEGLSVTLLEGQPNVSPVNAVLSGKADFGISNAELVLDRMNGEPVVAVAAIYQHSPYIVIAKPSIFSIQNLAGKRVMLEEDSAELQAYLASEDLSPSDFTVFPHTGSVAAFEKDEVDAMTAYVTTEPYMLDQAGVAYRIFDPKASGIDFYGDTLFTSDSLARGDPELVRKVRSAVIKGWTYALSHQSEMIDLILARYSTRITRDQLSFEAAMIRKLAIPEVVEIGYMNPGRWQYIADSFAKAKLGKGDVILDDFLFDTRQPLDASRFYEGLIGISAITLVILAIAGRLRGLNNQLKAEIIRRNTLEETLRLQADTDFLTGLPNRRRFHDVGTRELLKAQRFKTPLTALMIDIDHFKTVNDAYGHGIGDMVIRRVGELCAGQLRDVDSLARMGGEEYAVLLTHATTEQGIEVAERIRNAVESTSLIADGHADFCVTCSIGVTSRSESGDLQDLLQAADRALYQAKSTGRNRVCVTNAVLLS